MNAPVPEGTKIVYAWPEFPTKIEPEKLRSCAEEHNPEVQIALAEVKKTAAALKLIRSRHIILNPNLSFTRSRDDNDNLFDARPFLCFVLSMVE